MREYDKRVIERDDARRDRDEWKASATQYHKENEWFDAERSKFIAALRAIDPKHTLLPQNAKLSDRHEDCRTITEEPAHAGSDQRLVRDLSPEQVADYEKQWRDATDRMERWIPWEHKTPFAHQIIADEFSRQQRMEALLGYILNSVDQPTPDVSKSLH